MDMRWSRSDGEVDTESPQDVPNTTNETESNRTDYAMSKGGIALLFNHEKFNVQETENQIEEKVDKRDGTILDAFGLEAAFNKYGFHLKPYKDLTYEGIMGKIKDVAETDHSDYDCLVVICLTHGRLSGDGQELLYARDTTYPPSDLWLPFSDENCPSLAGKPKIYIIQACRGEELNYGIRVKKQPSHRPVTDCKKARKLSRNSQPKVHNMPDLLVARSTFIGFKSLRDPERGAVYIRTLVNLMGNELNKNDIVSFLTKVNRDVAREEFEHQPDKENGQDEPSEDKMFQVPCFTSTLTKLLYFP